jgi:hypothetical protein
MLEHRSQGPASIGNVRRSVGTRVGAISSAPYAAEAHRADGPEPHKKSTPFPPDPPE